MAVSPLVEDKEHNEFRIDMLEAQCFMGVVKALLSVVVSIISRAFIGIFNTNAPFVRGHGQGSKNAFKALLYRPFVLSLKTMKSRKGDIYSKQHRHHQRTLLGTIEGVHYDE